MLNHQNWYVTYNAYLDVKVSKEKDVNAYS